MDTQRDAAGTQALDGQGVINLSGAGIIDRERTHGGQRQLFGMLRRRDGRKARPPGEVLKQKALVVKLVGRCNRARLLQQIQRRDMAGPGCLHHRFVLGAVFVRLEKYFVELVAYRLWAHALRQLLGPARDLQCDLLFLFNRRQGELQDIGGGLFEATLSGASKVVRGLKQPKQCCGLLLKRRRFGGIGAEIIACQIGKTKFIVAGKFPSQFKLDVLAELLCPCHQLRWGRLFKLQQGVGRLDLDALARVQLDL